MKTSIASGAVAILLFSASAAASAGERTITLAVENMVCVVCAFNVKRSLENVPGVLKADVSLKDKVALVVYDDSKADPRILTTATAQVGFPSIPKN